MDRIRKLELVQRSLGLRHKLRVHESMKAPDTHEDMSLMLLAKWELEDELLAIEEVLKQSRRDNVDSKKTLMEQNAYNILRKGEKLLEPSLSKKN